MRSKQTIYRSRLHSARVRDEESGFTVPELVVVIATIAVLAVAVYPALANGKPRSQQVICFNNLRQVGQAVMLFNAENGQTDPWRTPGAGYQFTPGQNIFVQCSFLSNDLSSPKIFACPSDGRVRVARDFSASNDGGFFHPNYRNGAVSYFWGLDSSANAPDSVLSGDRNIRVNSNSPGGCSSGIALAFPINRINGTPGWAEGLHGPVGNILLHDGHVEQTSSESVKFRFTRSDDNGLVHLQFPTQPST